MIVYLFRIRSAQENSAAQSCAADRTDWAREFPQVILRADTAGYHRDTVTGHVSLGGQLSELQRFERVPCQGGGRGFKSLSRSNRYLKSGTLCKPSIIDVLSR